MQLFPTAAFGYVQWQDVPLKKYPQKSFACSSCLSQFFHATSVNNNSQHSILSLLFIHFVYSLLTDVRRTMLYLAWTQLFNWLFWSDSLCSSSRKSSNTDRAVWQVRENLYRLNSDLHSRLPFSSNLLLQLVLFTSPANPFPVAGQGRDRQVRHSVDGWRG